MRILTDNAVYDIWVAEPHAEQGRDHLLEEVGPLEAQEDLLIKAEDEAYDFHIALVFLEQNLDLG